MPTQTTTIKHLHTRLQSTHELLRQIADENTAAVRQLKPTELSAELWFKYRRLSEQLSATAADTEALKEIIGNFAKLPSVQSALRRTAA
jgi:hypothetical protein